MLITSPDSPTPETPAADDTPVAETEIPPGKKYTRPGWNGKEHKKNPRGKKNAANQKSMKAAPSGEIYSGSKRNVFPGKIGLDRAAIGLPEGKETTYNKEEQVLFGSAKEVKSLISSLMEINKDEQEA
jgi:hypothetical protein